MTDSSAHPSSSRPRTLSPGEQISPAGFTLLSTHLSGYQPLWWGCCQPGPITISTSWALSAAVSHLFPSFLILLFPPFPKLLLPWEELFLGAVLLGTGYHEGNVTKTVGKAYGHPEPCQGHRESAPAPALSLRASRVPNGRALPSWGLLMTPWGFPPSKLVRETPAVGTFWPLSAVPPR